MKVFLSHSTKAEDGPPAARLRAIAAAYGIQVLLPVRQPAAGAELRRELERVVAASDGVVVLATRDSTGSEWVRRELEVARSLGKPVVVLVERGLDWPDEPGVRMVHFDRGDPAAHERELVPAVAELRNQAVHSPQKEQQVTALGWLAGIAVGMLGLGGLAASLDEPEEELGL